MNNLESNSSQKEAFLSYLKKMDIAMLDIVLPEDITYFGANKTYFLERLAYITNQFKLAGEARPLNINQKDEFSNSYYLTSNILDFEQEFIIEEKEGYISNISSSLEIKSIEELEELHCLEIYFGKDERTDFIPSTDYVIKLHKCRSAYEEIVNDNIQILENFKISYWIKKHKSLYKEIKNDTLMFRLNEFKNLYLTLKYIKKQLKCSLAAEIAIRSFDDTSYSTIQKWKDDFNRLFFCELQSFEVGFSVLDRTNNTLKMNNYPNIIFKGTEFFSIFEFNKLYIKHSDFHPILIEDDDIPF
ncbi:hypothetical protein [Flavobacterium sp.]|jgi:hypothetical protein|uniref:hypothetical protein n=1 Tax=Flavobacterium sp. TaxID=239 RepID=UPI0037BF7FEA